jgi:hypothetical protein
LAGVIASDGAKQYGKGACFVPTPLIVILGGDTLAFKVAELLVRTGSNVVLVSDPTGDAAGSAARLGARFAPRFADERRTFAEAGMADATVAMALTDDDHENLQFVRRFVSSSANSIARSAGKSSRTSPIARSSRCPRFPQQPTRVPR